MQGRKVPQGVFAPVAAIFGADGELGLKGFGANMELDSTSALDGVVVLSLNRESVLVDRAEKFRLMETAVRTIASGEDHGPHGADQCGATDGGRLSTIRTVDQRQRPIA